VHQSRLVTGLAALFGGMTVVLVGLAVAFNLFILLPAVLFGAITYILWQHGTGRMAAKFYRRVEQRAAQGEERRAGGARGRGRTRTTDGRGRANGGRGGFGAGPREEWRGPRAEQRARQRQRRRAPTATRSPSPKEAFDILGVGPDADQAQIKAAYREKVKEVHPDTDGGDEEQFKRVNRAYERLRED
jgi:hypothetical protein